MQNIERLHSEKHLRCFCSLFPKKADSGGVERAGQTLIQNVNNRIKQWFFDLPLVPLLQRLGCWCGGLEGIGSYH
ncbi:transposase [Gluconobacter wancherniae]|uniref:transposase n=1 Tax=Gluconobacter wancherniae TaxID=1307955 RepID=UPI0035310A95